MPPKRGAKRKGAAAADGKRIGGATTVAKLLEAYTSNEAAAPPLPTYEEKVEYVESAIQRLTDKDYCEKYGEDYDMVLFHGVPPKEREAMLARARAMGEDSESDEENDENDPGTIVKGRKPAASAAETPSAKRPRGARVLRSARKGGAPAGPVPAAPAETPSRSTRAALRAANTATRTASRPTASTTTGRGSRKVPNGVATNGAAAAPIFETAAGKEDGDSGAGRLGDGKRLPPSVVAELRKRAKPNITVDEHLDAIIQPRIDDVPTRMQERCENLRQKLKEGIAVLRAKLPRSSEGEQAEGASRHGASASPRQDKDGGARTEEGGTAQITLRAEGGPYDGCVFNMSIEEDGEARMLGRSTGKKFKQKGVSLSKDSEVSISHGKFENSAGRVTFMDVGSTNGTEVDGEPAEQGAPYQMRTGSKLSIGQSDYAVVITWER